MVSMDEHGRTSINMDESRARLISCAMRDLFAALIAVVLLVLALSLATGLQTYNKRRKQTRRAARDRGQTIVAELPSERDLTLFSEDQTQFYYADHAIPKDQIHAVRVLINGSPIAVCLSPRFPSAASAPGTSVDERPEGIAHDRWDVTIEATSGTTLIECGAIREGVSQELARKIFEAVKKDMEA